MDISLYQISVCSAIKKAVTFLYTTTGSLRMQTYSQKDIHYVPIHEIPSLQEASQSPKAPYLYSKIHFLCKNVFAMSKVSSGVRTSLMATGLQYNCVNNKMLESDWFLTTFIYCLIWLMQHHNCPI